MRDASGGCPVRKLTPPGETATGPDVERVHGPDGTRVVVRSFALAREVLRDEDGYRQAGFGAETVRTQSTMRPPILYLDGPDHRAQRRASAPFFTPKAVEAYRPMMEELAERLVAGLRPDRGTDLADLAMRMAVEVVGRVVGLTHSSLPGMTSGSTRSSTATRCPRRSRSAACRGCCGRIRRRSGSTGRRQARDPRAPQGPAGRPHQRDAGPGLQRPGDPHRGDHLRRGGDGHDPGADQCRRLAPARGPGAAGPVPRGRPRLPVGTPAGDAPARTGRRPAAAPRRPRGPAGGPRRRGRRGRGRPRRHRRARGERRRGGGRCRTAPAVSRNERCRVGSRRPSWGSATATTSVRAVRSRSWRPRSSSRALFRRDIVADGPPRVRWNPVSQGYDLDRFMLRAREVARVAPSTVPAGSSGTQPAPP